MDNLGKIFKVAPRRTLLLFNIIEISSNFTKWFNNFCWYFLLRVRRLGTSGIVANISANKRRLDVKPGLIEMLEGKNQLQIWLKTVSVHSYSQLPELQDNFSREHPVILIARITPIFTKNMEEGTRLVNELYSAATKKNYSVFRLGEERIIVVPPNVQVKEPLW